MGTVEFVMAVPHQFVSKAQHPQFITLEVFVTINSQSQFQINYSSTCLFFKILHIYAYVPSRGILLASSRASEDGGWWVVDGSNLSVSDRDFCVA